MNDYDLAREILGDDFISPEDIMVSRNGIIYTDKQLMMFRETIPFREVLEWCRGNNYMLVAGPNNQMSFLDIRKITNDYFYTRVGGWYLYDKFSKEDKVETKWYMIRKNCVPLSVSKNLNEQKSLLSEFETIPNAPEFAWAITTYKAVRDIYLFLRIFVRTSSVNSHGDNVVVGEFSEEGLCVDYFWPSIRENNLGLAISRK